jgi:hypothetical protein
MKMENIYYSDHMTLPNGIHCTHYIGYNFFWAQREGIYLSYHNKNVRVEHKSRQVAFERAMGKMLKLIAKDVLSGKASVFDSGFDRENFINPLEQKLCEKCSTVLPKDGAYR